MAAAPPFEQLGARLGHGVGGLGLLEQALTHSSFANEHPGIRDNGALDFLGDAVLALVVGEHFWRAYPDQPEGVLTPKRAELVSGANLFRWARKIGLGSHLRLGVGEEQMDGREKESVLATALEAVLAVVYLDARRGAAPPPP